jgi:hypothetical protein
MSVFFAVLVNAIIVFSILAFLASVVWLCLRAEDPIERVRRLLAMLLGVMIVAVSQTKGLSYPAFMAKSLSSSKPSGGGILFLATVIPGGVGVGMGWYMIYVYRRRPRLAARILALVGVLAAGALAGLYANASNAKGLHLGAAAIPNIAFVSGLVFYVVFTDEEKSGLSLARRFTALRARVPKG